jgi:hypothetical protein
MRQNDTHRLCVASMFVLLVRKVPGRSGSSQVRVAILTPAATSFMHTWERRARRPNPRCWCRGPAGHAQAKSCWTSCSKTHRVDSRPAVITRQAQFGAAAVCGQGERPARGRRPPAIGAVTHSGGTSREAAVLSVPARPLLSRLGQSLQVLRRFSG